MKLRERLLLPERLQQRVQQFKNNASHCKIVKILRISSCMVYDIIKTFCSLGKSPLTRDRAGIQY